MGLARLDVSIWYELALDKFQLGWGGVVTVLGECDGQV